MRLIRDEKRDWVFLLKQVEWDESEFDEMFFSWNDERKREEDDNEDEIDYLIASRLSIDDWIDELN